MADDAKAMEDWLKVLGFRGFPEGQTVSAPPAAAPALSPAEPVATKHLVDLQENDALAKMSSETLRQQNLTQRDPKELFTPKYMDGLVGLKVKGANDKRLKEVMRKLAKGVSPGERKSLIAELAAIRGVDPDELDTEYDRFMILRAQQEAIQKDKNEHIPDDAEPLDAVPDLAEDIHNDFMGSNSQLVFGKVIGDAFGVDPVFGALLSPTGGMVGPGNKAVQMDDDDPTGYHGIVHDAAGYLHNYHDQGPGYDYLGKENSKGHSTDDPLTGQQSGMRYWHEKLDPGIETTVMAGVIDEVYACRDGYSATKKSIESAKDSVSQTAEKTKEEAAKALDDARKSVANAVDHAIQVASGKAKATETALEKAAAEAAEAAEAAKNRVAQTATTAIDTAEASVGFVRDATAEKLNAAWDYVWS